MSKTKIILASILKPVDDTRMYEKIGISLGQTNKYDINIIGFYPKKIPSTISSIRLQPLFNFDRISFKRIIAPFNCFFKYIKEKPQLIIFNTHELLIVTVLYKILFGCKICYDIQENYYRNVLYGNGSFKLFRPILAAYIRLKEYATNPWINLYFLAEKSYEMEFTFSRKKSVTLENKYRSTGRTLKRPITNKEIVLVFSGTLAETTGVFQTIEIARRLHVINSGIRLIIIGYCAQKHILHQIEVLLKKYPFISLIGGSSLVPHTKIIETVEQANFGMISYPKNKSTENSIPTKLYEYLALQLPIILQKHETWERICQPYQACIAIDYDTADEQSVLKEMTERHFYVSTPGAEVLWDSEEEKLLHFVEKILS